MGIKTIAYEGSSTTHFFFLNSSCDSIKFSEAKICGGVGDDWTAFPITNIIFLGDYKRFCTK
jgi:hypothetical protein